MLYIIRFAWKNVFRYGRRTAITAGAMAMGIAMFLWMDSVMKGFYHTSLVNFIDYESAHVSIAHRDFRQLQEEQMILDLDYAFDGREVIIAALRQAGFSAAARTRFSAGLSQEGETGDAIVTAVGIDVENDETVFKLKGSLQPGSRWLKAGEYGVILGSTLARNRDISVGEKVLIDVVRRDGFQDRVAMTVVGICTVPNPAINRDFLFLPLDAADTILALDGAVTNVYVCGSGKMQRIIDRVKPVLASLDLNSKLEAVSWEVLGKDWLTFARTKTAGGNAFVTVLFLIAAVGVINTMLMSYFERTRELGMMRALGMEDRKVVLEFFLEGAFIGAFGGLAGVLSGGALVALMVYYGFRMDFGDIDIGFRVGRVTYGMWNFGKMGFALALTTVVSALASLYPARKAVSARVAEVLRED